MKLDREINVGIFVSVFFKRLYCKKDIHILMVGLDAAGKTTILYKLTKPAKTSPLSQRSDSTSRLWSTRTSTSRCGMWGVRTQDKIRPLWRHYYTNTQALTFVVDCNDRDDDRIAKARDDLHQIAIEDEL